MAVQAAGPGAHTGKEGVIIVFVDVLVGGGVLTSSNEADFGICPTNSLYVWDCPPTVLLSSFSIFPYEGPLPFDDCCMRK